MTINAVETLVPILTCGSCGAPTTAGQRFCKECGVLLGRTALLADADLLRGVVPAETGRVVLARAVDTAVCLLAAAAGAALLVLADPRTGDHRSSDAASSPIAAVVTGALVGLLVAVAVVVLLARRTGRGPGGLVAGTRVVDATTGLPAGPLVALTALAAPSRRTPASVLPTRGPWARATGTLTATLRDGGRDPLMPALAPLGVTYGAAASAGVRPAPRPGAGGAAHGSDATGLGGSEATRIGSGGTAQGTGSRLDRGAPVDVDVPEGAVVLSFDSGAVHWFANACVVGRNPGGGDGVVVVAVPDLSRTLSKTHVALRLDEHGVTARDLGSTNGTSVLRPDGRREDLLPGVDAVVPDGSTVGIGDHAFRVDRNTPTDPDTPSDRRDPSDRGTRTDRNEAAR